MIPKFQVSGANTDSLHAGLALPGIWWVMGRSEQDAYLTLQFREWYGVSHTWVDNYFGVGIFGNSEQVWFAISKLMNSLRYNACKLCKFIAKIMGEHNFLAESVIRTTMDRSTQRSAIKFNLGKTFSHLKWWLSTSSSSNPGVVLTTKRLQNGKPFI